MRSLGIKKDTASSTGGSTFDSLGGTAPATIPAPDTWIPVNDGSGNADPGITLRDRNNEVRGLYGMAAPQSFAAAPGLSFTSRAYPEVLRWAVPLWMSSNPTNTGTAPAAITSKFAPASSQVPRAVTATLVREGQTDELAGLAADTVQLNFPVDQEGTIEFSGKALYHQVSATGSPPTPSFTGFDDVWQVRDAKLYNTNGVVLVPCFAGFEMSFDAGLIDDFRSRYCAGKNIVTRTDGGIKRRLWYPNVTKRARHTITGRIDFGDVQPTQEINRMFAIADKLVFEVTGGTMTTTPAADELMRITIYNSVLNGGGAEPLQSDGDQVSSYEFGAYLDGSNKDVEIEFVGAIAIPNP